MTTLRTVGQALLSHCADEKMHSDKPRDGLALLSVSRWGQAPPPPCHEMCTASLGSRGPWLFSTTWSSCPRTPAEGLTPFFFLASLRLPGSSVHLCISVLPCLDQCMLVRGRRLRSAGKQPDKAEPWSCWRAVSVFLNPRRQGSPLPCVPFHGGVSPVRRQLSEHTPRQTHQQTFVF